MRFSILITVYDRREYVERAIKSVKNQILNDLEIIVISNIDLKLDDDIIYIRSHEKSLSGKIIEGISMASGDVICFLEDDDEFKPEKLVKISKYFDMGYDYVHNALITDNADKGKIINIPGFNMSSTAISINLARSIKIPENINTGLDIYIYARAMEFRFVNIDEPLTVYHSDTGNSTIYHGPVDEFYKRNIEIYNRSLNDIKTFLPYTNGPGRRYSELFIYLSCYGILLMSADRKGIFRISFRILYNNYMKKSIKNIIIFTIGSLFHFMFPGFIRNYLYKRSHGNFSSGLDFFFN
ncbi:glycosyltransferase family 2 protein [Picrophilus oshimae]|uniref:Glycosyltransferase involved in cell wall bisynthesis n=1 Tax=Picrophilus torridus (strain ATCC 700027 / DSM 9790 / JCM 10055 / NBRC 100828 / KAW 2/3) TaxID=1122961 RepID=A0A8G2L7Y9_PICTO|nr:glycosyltransferase family 2 protein [Picrophilus oshimae]SMD30810.1 Glycosyltransferase involved in cell wall bisynthesis [Picrophilus oshimae DSM 9789]